MTGLKQNLFFRGWLYFTILAGLVVFSAAGWAQSADTDVLESQNEALRRIIQATGQALYSDGLSGEPVTYREVLRDPDNVELNLRFASTQISRGNFRGASATLERILLMAPNLIPIKLLYGVVLFRQGNLDEAKAVFNRLAALDLPVSIRAEVEVYLDAINRARQLTTYTASVSFGSHLDSNRTTAPRSNLRLLSDVPVTVARAESDFGYIGLASIRVDHNLGYQEGHSLFAALSYYQDEQTAEDPQDLQSFALEGGGVYRNFFMNGDLTAKLTFNQFRLSRETFLHEYGGVMRYDRSFSADRTGFFSANLAHQSFSPIFENSTSPQRNGRRISGMVGVSYAISPAHRIALDVQLLDRNAKASGAAEYFSYLRQRARLNHTWLLGEGQFLLSSFSYTRDRYADPDSFVSGRTRHNDDMRMSITYGAPLSFLLGKLGVGLWQPLEDVTFTPSVEFTRARSNLQNFDYSNWKIQGLFTKTWKF